MKKLLLVPILLLAGCMPNARKGLSQDVINHETRNMHKMDMAIYDENTTLLPMQMNNLSEKASWQDRMKAKFGKGK